MHKLRTLFKDPISGLTHLATALLALAGAVALMLLGPSPLTAQLALLALALGEAAQTGRWTSNRLVGGWLVLGFLGGLGFWSLSLIGVYLLPIAVYLSAAYWRRKALLVVLGLVAAAGFVAGAAPWIGHTVQHGLATVADSVGSSMPVPANYNLVLAVFRHLFYCLLFGVTVVWGLRPPWSAEFLALPLLPYALALHVGALMFTIRSVGRVRDHPTTGRALLLGMMATLVGAYLLTPYGEDPTGRYFVPLTFRSRSLWPRPYIGCGCAGGGGRPGASGLRRLWRCDSSRSTGGLTCRPLPTTRPACPPNSMSSPRSTRAPCRR